MEVVAPQISELMVVHATTDLLLRRVAADKVVGLTMLQADKAGVIMAQMEAILLELAVKAAHKQLAGMEEHHGQEHRQAVKLAHFAKAVIVALGKLRLEEVVAVVLALLRLLQEAMADRAVAVALVA